METALLQIEKTKELKGNSFIIIYDLDNFKRINDTYGHSIGDYVLKEVTARTTNTLRPFDLFARYGGEEFIILVSNTDEQTVIKLAEKVRLALFDMPIQFEEKSLCVSASFGIGPIAPEHDLETAIIYADNALYQAKEEGRNKVVLYS